MKIIDLKKRMIYVLLALMVLCTAIPVYVEADSKPKINSFKELSADNSVQLKITFKAKGTKSYKVWISTNKTSNYKKVSYKKKDSGENEKVTIKKCGSSKIQANKTYYVKITIYSKKNYKGGKTTKIYKIFSAPTITGSITAGDVKETSVSISWSKVKGATGYQLYLNDKIYSLKGVIKSVSGLKANQKYEVKVRAYKQVKVNGKTVKLYGSLKSSSFTTAVNTSGTKTIVSTSIISTGDWQNISATDNTYTEQRFLTNGCDMKILYANENDADAYENAIGYRISTSSGTAIHSFFVSGYDENSDYVVGFSGLPGQIVIGSYKCTTTDTTTNYYNAYRMVDKRITYSDGSTENVSETEYYRDVYPDGNILILESDDTYSDFHIDPYYADLFDQYYDNNDNYNDNRILIDDASIYICDNVWYLIGFNRHITGPITYDFYGYIDD